MRKSFIFSALLLASLSGIAQTGPVGSPPASNANAQAAAAWYRGGNNQTTNNNIFGTMWDSPIYTVTFGLRRMKLNGSFSNSPQYPINGYTASEGVNTAGYLLLGQETAVAPVSNTNIYTGNSGAFSLLHLNGATTGELAYRPWMKTGVTFTDANDLGYVGLRWGNDIGAPTVSEMTIAWGNENAGASGPDDMVFRFVGTATDHLTTVSPDATSVNDYDGRHIARFAASGNLGIGPNYTHLAGPTHRLDADGNARLRVVPAANAPEYLMLGNVVGGPSDIEFQRLGFPNNANMFLDGTGQWQVLPTGNGNGTIIGAHNGLSVSNQNPSMIALGQNVNEFGANPAALSESRYVPLNDHDLYFTNNPTNPNSNTGYNKVGIGADNGTLGGKLTVVSRNSGESTTVDLLNTATEGAIGTRIRVLGVDNTTNFGNWGQRIRVLGAGTQNQGTEYVVSGGSQAIGVTIDAYGGSTSNLGMSAFAHGACQTNTGIIGRADSAGTNYGIIGIAPVGGNNRAGRFDGDVEINGTGYSTNGIFTGSDQRFKQDIKPLESVCEKIAQLNGYTYNLRPEEFAAKNFARSEQIGLLAQEVQAVFPQLVREDADGYLAVNYDGLVPVLLEAVKSQQQQIDELKELVQPMASTTPTTNIQVVELSNDAAPGMDQNAPNPFSDQTVIAYTLPASVQRAQILVHDGMGNLIQTVDIQERGRGSLHVLGSKLAAGNYTYSLVADGKVIASKVMVKL